MAVALGMAKPEDSLILQGAYGCATAIVDDEDLSSNFRLNLNEQTQVSLNVRMKHGVHRQANPIHHYSAQTR